MGNISDPPEHAGWESIWRSGDIPPKYRTLAAPNPSVVDWTGMLPPGGFVLDLGCGVGRHVIYLGGCGFQVAGVDISPSGVRLAQEACAERQIAFDGRVSDMNALPWPDGTFDGVLSTSTIHHHRRADLARTLAEVWRVLKPGGHMLADFACTSSLDYQHMRNQVAAGKLTEVEPNTFVDERPDPDPMDDLYLPHHYSDEADLRDLLRAFEIVKLQADLREGVIGDRSGPLGKWVVWARKPRAA